MQKRRIRKIIPVTEKIVVNDASRVIVEKRNGKGKTTKVIAHPSQSAKVKKSIVIQGMPSQRTQLPFSTVQPIWKGETVFVIGGGPSLSNFNWESLRNRKVIAVNKAFLNCPWAGAMFWTDSRFYQWYKDDINNFSGLKYTIRPKDYYPSNIDVLRKGARFGLETSPSALAHGNNSGYAAINLAYHMGAKQIILLGYDMGNDGKRSHYHEGYPVNPTSDKTYKEQFIPGFESLHSVLSQKGIPVWNASPHSKLDVFPKITITKALTLK